MILKHNATSHSVWKIMEFHQKWTQKCTVHMFYQKNWYKEIGT